MTRGTLLILVALAAGLGAYALTRQFQPAPPTTEGFDELAWLRQEFALTPTQIERIAALEAAYRPICDAHCARIAELQHQVTAAQTTGRAPPTEALAKAAMTCMQASRAHLRDVAAVMPAAQGQRYLALVEPKLVQHDHTQPFGLQ